MVFLYSSGKKKHYTFRRIGYDLNVIQQSASLVFNTLMVDTCNDDVFFNCTPVRRASDSTC